MANNSNEIVDSDTNCTKQTDCFVYCNAPNTTNEGLPMSDDHKSFHKMLMYFIRSTVKKIQSQKKKFTIRKRSVSIPCKLKEIATCSSLSSIVDNVIEPSAKTVAKIKQKLIDAIASTTRSGEVFDKVTCENLPGTVEHFVQCTSYRYAEYAAKYVDDAVPERGCGPVCIGIGTQSNIVDREFSLETSPDAFAKACEKRRHADFILEEIGKVSDALTEKARLDSVKEQAASILASVSVTTTGYEIGEDEETFESTKPLISSIIHAEEKPTAVAVADAAVTVMQPETLIDTQVLVTPSSSFAPDSRDFSICSGKSLDAPDIRASSINLKTKHARTVSVMYPERDDLRDIVVARKKKKEEEKKKISLQPTTDKHVLAVNKSCYAAVIVNCIPKLKKTNSKSLDLYQPNDVQTDAAKQKAVTVKNGIIDSSIETLQVEGEPTQIAKEVQEPVPCKYKVPKYRAKYRIVKEEKKPELKEIPKDSDKISKYTCLTFPLPKTTSKFFNYSERSATELNQDCRCKLPKYLQPIRHCDDLIPNNIYLGRSKCCDIWTIPCFSSQNEATRNATLSHVHCRLLQDSRATEYRASCHSLVGSHASFGYYNVNASCTKRRVTFENSLCTNTYCKSDAKYCYPLNNIDNVRMGYYHYNDSCPVWNNNQHCGRDRSYYWTKGNLYFTHP